MGKEFSEIDAGLQKWVERQQLFFVATAPLSGDGLVNCSPKGRDTLRILGPRQIAYLDLGGSGIETVAHVKENRRIVIMLCAFDGPPKIVRFHGLAQVIEHGDDGFAELVAGFAPTPSPPRSVIRVTSDVSVIPVAMACRCTNSKVIAARLKTTLKTRTRPFARLPAQQ